MRWPRGNKRVLYMSVFFTCVVRGNVLNNKNFLNKENGSLIAKYYANLLVSFLPQIPGDK